MAFETGNAGDLSDAWLRRLGRLSFPEHLYLFGPRSITELLRRSGLELIAAHHHSLLPWLTAVKLAHRLRAARSKRTDPSSTSTAPNRAPTTPAQSPGSPGLAARLRGRAIHHLKYRLPLPQPRTWPAHSLYLARPSGARAS